MEYKIYHNPDFEFWGYAGKFFASRNVEKEMGSAIHHDAGMMWIICIRDNEGIGISAIAPKGTYVFLKHAYVYPEYREQGVYHQMLKMRLALIKEMGYAVVKTRCTNMSKPILEKFGFAKVGEVGRYSIMELEI